jgi:hypothetical protein
MHLTRRTTLLATLLLSAIPYMLSQPATGPSGHWEGAIQAESKAVKIEIDLVRNTKGELTGVFGSPVQDLKGLPLSNFALDGDTISFQIKGTTGERAFKGKLSADGKAISGDYNQSGYTVSFALTRTGDPKIEAQAKNAAIGKELEGTWTGTMEAEGRQLRIVLTMSNQSDGTAIGSMVSVDEGLEIPITTITQKASSLTLEIKAVGGVYSGTLNTEGTELAGTYTQRQVVLPLTLRRSAATASK